MSEAYDLFQKRILDQRKIPKDRLIADKLNGFKAALEKSYNAESIDINGIRTKGFITRVDSSPKIKTEGFSALSQYCSIGSIVYWVRDNSYWMISEQNKNEAAYFNGSLLQALYEVTWRDDETGKNYSTRSAVKGPEETTHPVEYKQGITVNTPNLSLTLIISKDADGVGLLKRYSQVFVNGEKWEVVAYDKYTDEHLITFEMIEKTIDKEFDDTDNQIPGGMEDIIFTHTSALSDFPQIESDTSIANLAPVLFRNDEIYDSPYVVGAYNCTLTESGVILDTVGMAKVIYTYPEISKIFTYETEVTATPVSEKVFAISGASLVSAYLESTYTVSLKENGRTLVTEGDWTYDETFFEGVLIEYGKLVLKATGVAGNTSISYTFNGETVAKVVKVAPIFEN